MNDQVSLSTKGMRASELQQKLIEWSVANSGYDSHRAYIGLSGIIDCDRVIYRRYFETREVPAEAKLKTKITYELEDALRNRLSDMGLAKPGVEISEFGGMVKGHTDGEIKGCLLEIKTVAEADHLPTNRVPYRVYWQVQAYMYYGDYRSAYVIYLDRSTGQIRVFDINLDDSMGRKIQAKLIRIIRAIECKTKPKCLCGKCQK